MTKVKNDNARRNRSSETVVMAIWVLFIMVRDTVREREFSRVVSPTWFPRHISPRGIVEIFIVVVIGQVS
jgi:hypothetical protein